MSVLFERPRLTVPVTERDHVLGPATAPVTLVEYGDYECPFCGAAHASVAQVRQVMGNDTAIMVAGQSSNFELNVMLPLTAYNLLQSIELLSNACEMEWQRKTPRRLVSTTRSHSASVISAAGVPGCSTPALLKAISSRPNLSAALRRADWTWSMT